MRGFVHFIPIATTFVSFAFAYMLWSRYLTYRSGPHLAWWAAGVTLYGVGTLTESLVKLHCRQEVVFRSW